eukprot:gnl/MRDRNA2_/MRDRNA2_102441_c0_seq1.p1 gnl/MRDRNA2_/MRDRNA2_102441_c0~~gnl/MRDRNA2_/MRDRNA2_102441_c0_seq1.p1  ORF type:complete len:863 (-),score=278.97 gnl/MRDRNA2_/MRDRNA2_102441_c0_seq1:53-2641(-)
MTDKGTGGKRQAPNSPKHMQELDQILARRLMKAEGCDADEAIKRNQKHEVLRSVNVGAIPKLDIHSAASNWEAIGSPREALISPKESPSSGRVGTTRARYTSSQAPEPLSSARKSARLRQSEEDLDELRAKNAALQEELTAARRAAEEATAAQQVQLDELEKEKKNAEAARAELEQAKRSQDQATETARLLDIEMEQKRQKDLELKKLEKQLESSIIERDTREQQWQTRWESEVEGGLKSTISILEKQQKESLKTEESRAAEASREAAKSKLEQEQFLASAKEKAAAAQDQIEKLEKQLLSLQSHVLPKDTSGASPHSSLQTGNDDLYELQFEIMNFLPQDMAMKLANLIDSLSEECEKSRAEIKRLKGRSDSVCEEESDPNINGAVQKKGKSSFSLMLDRSIATPRADVTTTPRISPSALHFHVGSPLETEKTPEDCKFAKMLASTNSPELTLKDPDAKIEADAPANTAGAKPKKMGAHKNKASTPKEQMVKHQEPNHKDVQEEKSTQSHDKDDVPATIENGSCQPDEVIRQVKAKPGDAAPTISVQSRPRDDQNRQDIERRLHQEQMARIAKRQEDMRRAEQETAEDLQALEAKRADKKQREEEKRQKAEERLAQMVKQAQPLAAIKEGDDEDTEAKKKRKKKKKPESSPVEEQEAEVEHSELEQLARIQMEQERLEKENERLEQEKERLLKERLEAEAIVTAVGKKKKKNKKQLEEDLAEKERVEKERLAKLRLEQERVETERLEMERLHQELLDKQKEKEDAESKRKEANAVEKPTASSSKKGKGSAPRKRNANGSNKIRKGSNASDWEIDLPQMDANSTAPSSLAAWSPAALRSILFHLLVAAVAVCVAGIVMSQMR